MKRDDWIIVGASFGIAALIFWGYYLGFSTNLFWWVVLNAERVLALCSIVAGVLAALAFILAIRAPKS